MDIKTVDLRNGGDYTDTKPVSLFFDGMEFKYNHWTELCAKFFEKVQENHRDKITHLARYAKEEGGWSFLSLHNGTKLKGYKRLNHTDVWLKVGYDANDHIGHIRKLIEYCALDVSKIEIRIRHKDDNDSDTSSSTESKDVNRSGQKSEITSPEYDFQKLVLHSPVLSFKNLNQQDVPSEIKSIIKADYQNGFEFNNTTIKNLEEKTKRNIPEDVQNELKERMYKRRDGVYFPQDSIVKPNIYFQIRDDANSAFEKFKCFELNSLYRRFFKEFNSACIRNFEDFEDWFKINLVGEVEISDYLLYKGKRRIIRVSSISQEGAVLELVRKIEDDLEKLGGILEENQFQEVFNLFSIEFLEEIIQKESEVVIVGHNKGQMQLRTFNTLGLPRNFSEELTKTITRIDELGLEATLDTINTMLSNNFGYNFRFIFNVLNDRVCRRLIETYYHGASREWKDGFFKKIEK